MIISIRGTSGSGKTTAMRQVLKEIGTWEKHYVEGRRQPLYYSCGPVVVLGHYEIDCGGCDTIGSAPKVYDTILKVKTSKFTHALTEGLLWSEDVKWTLALRDKGEEIRIAFLTTSVEECIARVVNRQADRKPADAERVRRKLTVRVDTIDRARQRLVREGVNCRRCSSAQAPGIVLGWLKG